MILNIQCSRCGEPMKLDYQPNEYFSQQFYINAAACDDCTKKKPFFSPPKLRDEIHEQARTPHND